MLEALVDEAVGLGGIGDEALGDDLHELGHAGGGFPAEPGEGGDFSGNALFAPAVAHVAEVGSQLAVVHAGDALVGDEFGGVNLEGGGGVDDG